MLACGLNREQLCDASVDDLDGDHVVPSNRRSCSFCDCCPLRGAVGQQALQTAQLNERTCLFPVATRGVERYPLVGERRSSRCLRWRGIGGPVFLVSLDVGDHRLDHALDNPSTLVGHGSFVGSSRENPVH